MLLLAFSLPAPRQTIPPVNAKALDDSEVILPRPGSSQFLLLLIGFSHKSGEFCTPWRDRLAADYTSDSHIAFYQLAELQDAPSMIRGFILRGMRKEVPAAQHSRFLPLYDHEDDWKKIVSFSAPDDPYLLLTAPNGPVLWQTNGTFSDSAYAALKSAVSKFAVDSPKP